MNARNAFPIYVQTPGEVNVRNTFPTERVPAAHPERVTDVRPERVTRAARNGFRIILRPDAGRGERPEHVPDGTRSSRTSGTRYQGRPERVPHARNAYQGRPERYVLYYIIYYLRSGTRSSRT